MSGPAPRFAVDAMLGRLARWLRALGFDTSYQPELADAVLVQRAHEECRVLLTRDRHLLRELRPQRALEIRQDDPLEQLRGVVAALELGGPVAMFSRCMLCNTALSAPLAPTELPALDFALPALARRCPTCGRIYWEGSHARRMREALERVLPGWGSL